MSDLLNLSRTRVALEEYDRILAETAPKWDAVETSEDVYALVSIEDGAGLAVAEAFAEDTKDRNSRSSALVVRPDAWLRGLVAKFAGG